MSLSSYLTGLAYFCGIWGSVALGTTVIARRRLVQLDGAAAVVGVATVGIVALVGVHLVPLGLGILSRPSVLVTAALFALGTFMLVRPGPSRVSRPSPASPPSSRVSWAIAGAAV